MRIPDAAWQATHQLEAVASIGAAVDQVVEDPCRCQVFTHAPRSALGSLRIGALLAGERRFPGTEPFSVWNGLVDREADDGSFSAPMICHHWRARQWHTQGSNIEPLSEKDRRARELLRSWLNPDLRRLFDKHGVVYAMPASKRVYLISERWVEMIARRKLSKDPGKAVLAFCLHPDPEYSIYDKMLSQFMMIEDDEESFLRQANVDGVFVTQWRNSREGKLMRGLRSMRLIESVTHGGMPLEARKLVRYANQHKPPVVKDAASAALHLVDVLTQHLDW